MGGAAFVPAYSWQPTGLSRVMELRASGKMRAYYDSLLQRERALLRYVWKLWARPSQILPPASVVPHAQGWKFWVILAGRGFGKTRTAAEALRGVVERGEAKRIALVGPTYRDVVQTMIKGESGLLACFPPGSSIRPRFVKNDNAVYFEKQGRLFATAFVYTGEEPERLRGPQHDFAWFDELGAFKYLVDVWRLFVAGHRLGYNPRGIFTTTPRASLLAVDGLLDHHRAVTTFGRSTDNKENLAPDTIETLEGIYKDTDFAEQELGGVLHLDDTGSIFKGAWNNASRVDRSALVRMPNEARVEGVPILKWIVMVDPSGSSKSSACECGIIVAGLGADQKVYIVEDRSKRATPDEWATSAVIASRDWFGASVVYEKNFGDEMVGALIRRVAKDLGIEISTIPVEAQQDKMKRAMLVSPLAQKGRVRLVGYFGPLERQLTTWLAGSGASPDRLDAYVWAVIQLLLKQPRRGMIV